MERRMEKASIYLWDLTSFKDIFICDISSTTLLNSCLNLGVTRATGCVKPGLIWWFRGPTYIYLTFLEFRFLSCLKKKKKVECSPGEGNSWKGWTQGGLLRMWACLSLLSPRSVRQSLASERTSAALMPKPPLLSAFKLYCCHGWTRE